jgi:hypothetical protein
MATITLRSAKGSPLTNNEVDANFTNLNNDKYESGSNVTLGTLSASTVTASGNITAQAYVISSINSGVAAAGSDQSGGTALAKTFNIVTSATASSAEGVVLPDAAQGLVLEILNDTSTTIKVYPYSGETIDGGSANVAVNLAGKHSLKLVCTSASNWVRLTPNIIYDSSSTRLN